MGAAGRNPRDGPDDFLRNRYQPGGYFDGCRLWDAESPADMSSAGWCVVRMAAAMGHPDSTHIVPSAVHVRDGGIEASAFRPPGGRIGTNRGLLYRVLGRQAGGLYDDRFRRDRAGLGAGDDILFRRMAGAVVISERV